MPPLERALALILERDDFFIASNVLGSLGYLQVLSGEHGAGIARMREALGEKAQWRIGLSRLVARLGEAYLLAGRVVEARASAGQCLALTRAHGERGYEAWALRLLGEIELADDAPDEAQPHLESALAMSEELGMKPMEAHSHAGLGRLHRRRGEAAAASRHRDAAAVMYREMGIEWWPARLDAASLSL
jgi:tetratricopeptide (TPR) repeat protein